VVQNVSTTSDTRVLDGEHLDRTNTPKGARLRLVRVLLLPCPRGEGMERVARCILVLVIGLLNVTCASVPRRGAEPPPGGPGAGGCAAKRSFCVELCRPLGVRHFACQPEVGGVEFECECLDGTTPLEPEKSQ
jgi:hypothetical protein